MDNRTIYKCYALYSDIEKHLKDSQQRLHRLYAERDSEIKKSNAHYDGKNAQHRARLKAIETETLNNLHTSGKNKFAKLQSLNSAQEQLEEIDSRYKDFCAGKEIDESRGNWFQYIFTGLFVKYMIGRCEAVRNATFIHRLTPLTRNIVFNGYSDRKAYISRKLKELRSGFDDVTLKEVEQLNANIAANTKSKFDAETQIKTQYIEEEKKLLTNICVDLSLLISKRNAFTANLRADNASWSEKVEMLKKGRIPADYISLGDMHLSLQPYREFAELIRKHNIDSDVAFTEDSITIPLCFSIQEDLSFNVLYNNMSKGNALSSINAFLLKLMASHLPRRIKLSLCDPEQLGQSFVPFLSYPRGTNTGDAIEICTDPTDITSHLVFLRREISRIQSSCLQDRYENIHEYNRDYPNSPVATRVLVYAGYPLGKNYDTENQLLSIINLGPRCGIHTIILSPSDNAEYVKHTNQLWSNINTDNDPLFTFAGSSISCGITNRQVSIPGMAVSVPDRDTYHPLISQIAENNIGASESIISLKDIIGQNYYTGSSEKELEIPFGMRQDGEISCVRMGNVASSAQQMLVVGRPRSGKSVFLHTLILSALAKYDADELLLYLIDMKKGVEFQDYARSSLPQLQVVAIESDREFAFSVIKHAADLMNSRAAAFKEIGVENIEAYRRRSGKKMPHVMIVIDEYQEIFQSNDRLGNAAAETIDAIVRTAGAFGIHLVLCSQTSVSAANMKTISRHMTVRLALACDRTVAGQIMSDDLSGSSRNSAVDLLPTFQTGQAVYNDNSGNETSNQFLRVAFMSSEERQQLLSELEALSAGKSYEHSTMHVAFSGNTRNRTEDIPDHPFTRIAAGKPYSFNSDDLRFIIGDAYGLAPYFAIKPTISARHNVVLVSDNEELASGIMLNAAMSAALSGDKIYSIALSMSRKGGARAYAQQISEIESRSLGYAASRPADAGAVLSRALKELEMRMNAFELPEKQSAIFVWGLQDIENLDSTKKIMQTAKTDVDVFFDYQSAVDVIPDKYKDKFKVFKKRASEAEEASASAFDDYTALDAFKTLIIEGPKYGMHVFAVCDSVSSFTSSYFSDIAPYFYHRICGSISAKEFSSLMTYQSLPSAPESAMFYFDSRTDVRKFKAYLLPDETTTSNIFAAAQFFRE